MKGDGSSAFAAVSTEKAHLLDTVITNIQLMSNYYKTVNLTYALKEDDALWKEFEKVGKFKIESL